MFLCLTVIVFIAIEVGEITEKEFQDQFNKIDTDKVCALQLTQNLGWTRIFRRLQTLSHALTELGELDQRKLVDSGSCLNDYLAV